MSRFYHASSFTILVTFLCLSLVGVALVSFLPIKLAPSRDLPKLSIKFDMPGNSSRVIESEVTCKLESMLSRVKGVQHIHSVSGNGTGSVTLELDKHSDMDIVRFEVSTIVRQTWPQLPEGVSYPQITTGKSDNTSERPFLTFSLNASAEPISIQQYAEEHIKPVLAQFDGVYKVELSGATPMEWVLEYDSKQLADLGISLADIKDAVGYYKKEYLGVCAIENLHGKGKEWLRVILTSSHQKDALSLQDIRVKTANGAWLDLNKIVHVAHVEERPQGYFRINGLNSIYLSVTAEETANQLRLGDKIKKTMSRLAHEIPSGYEVHVGYDATEYITKELNAIYFRTGMTVLVLLLFVALVTWSMRYLVLVFTTLVVNLAVAVIFYYTLGLEIQLYSLAGITISLNLVIDNTIVMADHIRRRRDLKVFMSILAATLTTIGALAVIFFLDERIRLNLQDFAAVVIVNLGVSLLVALFFVPSFMEKTGMVKRLPTSKGRTTRLFHLRMKRLAVYFSRFYVWLIGNLCRHRALALVAFVLAFGVPVFMMPDRLDGEGMWARWYNRVFDSNTYKEKVKPIADKVLGGSLRLFVEKVYEGSTFGWEEGEMVLSVYASLPNGSTLEQMDVLIRKMETYLSGFKGIRQFQTRIYNARQASIQIYFTKQSQRDGFPYVLKANIVSKALTLGGGSWGVYGLQDQGFSNDVREGAGNFQVKLLGYNYDELYGWAEKLKEKFLSHRRIKDVTIASDYSWWKDDYREFSLELDKLRMAECGITASQLFDALRPIFGQNMACGRIVTESGYENLKLSSRQGQEYDVWGLMHIPFSVNGNVYKLSDFATIRKSQSPQNVAKENQQYRLCLQYEYIGSTEQGNKLLKKDLEEFAKELPMGYTVQSERLNNTWGKKDNRQYALLVMVVAIIFFITSVLFNSLKQPLAIIFVIPISYIGVFLTFYLFGLNFDQGGFASFVLLCGITVNASIYILNEYNAQRKRFPFLTPVKAYVKAWNAKVIPIFLTIVSTMLGFVPFMVGNVGERFWFSLAAGTIGGLCASVVGIYLCLPMFSVKR